jgi:small GTP-binding protein
MPMKNLMLDFEGLDAGTIELARLVSIAVRVEPEFLRVVRLQLAPWCGASDEADLWFSSLVEARGIDGVVFEADVASQLRDELAEDEKVLQRAWEITQRYHASIPPILRLEEMVTWASLAGADSIVDEQLSQLVVKMQHGGQGDIIGWACHALPRFPARVNRSRFAWILHFASQNRADFRGGLKGAVPEEIVSPEVADILGHMPEVDLLVRRDGDVVEFGQVHSGRLFSVRVPDTDPRVIELIADDRRSPRTEIVSVPSKSIVRRRIGRRPIRIRSMGGKEYDVPSDVRPSDGFEYDAFLAHNAKDKPAVRELAERLTADGLRVWFDEWVIKPGDMIPLQIEKGLEGSRTLILFMSGNAFATEWGTLERHTALFRDPMNQKRRFVPLLLEDCEIRDPLRQFAYVDWRERDEAEYGRLLAVLSHKSVEATEVEETPVSVHDSILMGHSGSVWDVCMHPNGQQILSASSDSTVRVWDAVTGEAAKVLHGHQGTVHCITISPDGRFAASGATDETVRIWEVATGRAIQVIGTGSAVYSICWMADSGRIAFGTADGSVQIWTASGEYAMTPFESRASVCRVSRLPDNQSLLVALGNGQVKLVSSEGGGLARTVFEHDGAATSAVVTPDGSRSVSASYDRTIGVCELEGNGPTLRFEGHTEKIWRLAVSPDGQRVASAGWDRTVRLWSLETGACLQTLEFDEPVNSVAFSPDGTRLVSACDDCRVYISSVDLPAGRVESAAARYLAAKVVLVGETGVGKSGLRVRLTEDRFEPTVSTGSHEVFRTDWVTQAKLAHDASTAEIEREIWLWDFAGQADYRLIQQLFMDETALAVLVFNPQSENPLVQLGQWDWDLKRAAKREFGKLLVASRCDRGGLMVSDGRVREFARDSGFVDFLTTSAKTGQGCAELKQAIVDHIDWDSIPLTASPRIFKVLKDEIVRLRELGRTLLRMVELKQQLEMRLSNESFGLAELRAVVGLLAGPGLVRQLAFGDFVLLQPEWIGSYAGAVVRCVRQHKAEIGVIEEERVLAGDLDYHDMERLPDEEESIVLRAMHHELLACGICLRESTEEGQLLVFPSYFRRERPDIADPPPLFVTYSFAGNLDDIYATLIVRLYYARSFENGALWRYAADFATPDGRRMSVRMEKVGEGLGEIRVYFDPRTSDDFKVLFIRYVHDHLYQKGEQVQRFRHYVCPRCYWPVKDRELAMARLQKGMQDIGCANCDARVKLWDLIERQFASPNVTERVREMEERGAATLSAESRQLILVGEAFTIAGEAGQIFRPIAISDHGIDGEIEFKDRNGNASGKRVYLQLKSGDSYLKKRKRDGADIFRIEKARWAEHWRQQAYPVMLVIRTSDGEIRWMDVSKYLEEESRRSDGPVKQVVFDGEEFTAASVRRMWDRVIGVDG